MLREVFFLGNSSFALACISLALEKLCLIVFLPVDFDPHLWTLDLVMWTWNLVCNVWILRFGGGDFWRDFLSAFVIWLWRLLALFVKLWVAAFREIWGGVLLAIAGLFVLGLAEQYRTLSKPASASVIWVITRPFIGFYPPGLLTGLGDWKQYVAMVCCDWERSFNG